jgi:KDO2-lipid IV(A) lauroyltransferase
VAERLTVGEAAESPAATAEPKPRGEFWLRFFYWWTRHAPWGPRLTRLFWINASWYLSSHLREVTQANARCVLGPDATHRQIKKLAKRTHADFFDFICDLGNSSGKTLKELLQRIDCVDGADDYLHARQAKQGAILVTAHLGNFEVGMAEVRRLEPRVHVVFQRDATGQYENVRAQLHRQLGVIETPIDDGMASWIELRDALQDDAVVMLQGDRVMPGQKGQAVAVCHGHLELPIGPAKLAMMTGAPLIPVFAINTENSKVRIEIDPPIKVEDAGDIEPAVQAIGRSIERRIRKHPEQWHVLHRAFVEDQPEAED